jgi:hypothetical protein
MLDLTHLSPRNLIIIAVVVLLLIWRLRYYSSVRALKIERMWITPVLLLVVAFLTLSQTPLTGLAWLWLIPAFVAGSAVGFWRGRLTRVSIDPETHAFTSQTSQAGTLLVVALMAVRIGLRSYLTAEAGALHLNVALVTDCFLMAAIGLVAVQRLEIWIRARRLLTAARAAKAAA